MPAIQPAPSRYDFVLHHPDVDRRPTESRKAQPSKHNSHFPQSMSRPIFFHHIRTLHATPFFPKTPFSPA
jgi:hypothetical protein